MVLVIKSVLDGKLSRGVVDNDDDDDAEVEMDDNDTDDDGEDINDDN